MEKPNSGMYVPLHYSNLYKAVPEGEKILYSIFSKIILMGRDVNFQGQKKIWHSHLLITTKGMYFGKYQRTRQPLIVFISWLMVKNVRGSKIKTIKPKYILKPKREINFETKQRYRIRKKELTVNLQNIIQQGKKIILKEFMKKANLYRVMSQRERNLLKFLLGDQYIDDFDKVVVSILRTRYIIGNDRIEPKPYYVDIKKKRISNQINSVSIEIIAFLPFFLIFFFYWSIQRINPWDSLGVSMSILGIIYSMFLILDRLRIRMVNFKIPQLDDFPLEDGNDFLKYLDYKEKLLMDEFKEKQVLKEYKPILNQRMGSPDFLGKIAIFGDDNVGRSTLARDYLNSQDYNPHFITGVNFATKDVTINNHNVKLQVWFLSNLKYHEKFYKMFLQGILGAIIFYDITNINSLINIPRWIQTIKENRWILSRGDIPIILVGNKNDLERDRLVSKERGNELKEKYGLSLFMEVSLKTGEGVNDIFEAIANLIFKKAFS